MIKPKDTLLVARFTFPDCQWQVNRDGVVCCWFRIMEKLQQRTFGLDDHRDRQAAQMALAERNWKIEPRTRGGKQMYMAVRKHADGITELLRPTIEEAILAAVELEAKGEGER
jgi:hypothetical protein